MGDTHKELRRPPGPRDKPTHNAAVTEATAILQGALAVGWCFRMVSTKVRGLVLYPHISQSLAWAPGGGGVTLGGQFAVVKAGSDVGGALSSLSAGGPVCWL